MTDKTTAALKLAEEAAEFARNICLGMNWSTDLPDEALAAIREALAECKPAPDGRIPKTVFTIEDIGKAAEMGRQAGMIDALAEPVKQEPVAAMKKPNVEVITADVRAALCFALWHHQGGSSSIGQLIREILGLGQHDHMTSEQYFAAKRVAEALAEQDKQEPVEYHVENVYKRGDKYFAWIGDGYVQIYTAPVSAKREWVDLTCEEVTALIREGAAGGGWQGFATRVQDAFKDKNK